MRVSEISRFLNTLPSDTKPNVLADMIMELSNQKTSNKDVKQSLKDTPKTLSTGSAESIRTDPGSKRASDANCQAVPKSLIPVRVGTSLSGLERKCRVKHTKDGAKVRSMSADTQLAEDLVQNKSNKTKVGTNSRAAKNVTIVNGQVMKESIQKTVPDGEESDDDQTSTASNIVRNASPETTASQVYPNVDWHSPRPSLGGKFLDSQFQRNLSKHLDDLSLKTVDLPVGSENRDVLPADGEASVLLSTRTTAMSQNFSPPVKQTAADSQRETWRKEPSLALPLNFKNESNVQTSHSSNEMGITGHHIPDGTEYSPASDAFKLYNTKGTREEVVGTADNKLVDSRVFDKVGYNSKSGQLLQVSQVPVSATNTGAHSLPPTSTSQPMGIKTVSNRNSAPNLNTNANALTSSIPQITTVSVMSNTHSMQSTVPLRTFEGFDSEQNVVPTYHSHLWMQPQPPIDSYKHNLLPQSAPAPGKPTLLTKHSLHETEFAKKYLQAGYEHCETLCDEMANVNISNMSIPLDQFNELRPSLSPPRMGNNMLEPHQDLSILAHSPAYQSTPFTKAVTGSRVAPAHTVLTSSTMHSVWSTGPLEMATPLSKTDGMYQGRRPPEQFQGMCIKITIIEGLFEFIYAYF